MKNTLKVKIQIKDFYYNEAGVRLKLDKNDINTNCKEKCSKCDNKVYKGIKMKVTI
jgi:hypothetical protein